MRVAPGSRVRLHLSITLADGTVAESTFNDQPLTIIIGDGTLDEGLELALTGLIAGEQQTLTLMPGQAFGMPDPAAVRQVPLSDFPSGLAIEAGVIVGFTSPEGEEIAGTVVSVGDQQAEVDFNHPLAGKQIIFTAKILSIESPGELS